ncbi:MAG: hypothetical protein WKG32_06390 [Gemmatimonadaceae bacterium]
MSAFPSSRPLALLIATIVHVRVPLAAVLALTATGCAATTPIASSPRGSEHPPRAEAAPSRSVVTAGELATVEGASLFDALRRIRPEWSRHLSPADPDGQVTVVYVDGVRTGDMQALHGIPRASVRRVDLLSRVDAQVRYGNGHGGRAILVTTTR